MDMKALLETIQGWAAGAAAQEWDRLASIGSPYSIWSYAGAILVAAAIFASRAKGRITLRGLAGKVFPADVMAHPSTRTDMAMYARSMRCCWPAPTVRSNGRAASGRN